MLRIVWKSFLGLAFLAFVVLPVMVLVAAVELRPRVQGMPPADAAAAGQARDLIAELQAVALSGSTAGGWTVTEEALNGALAAGGRVVPGLAARAEVGPEAVALALSVPILADVAWLNLSASLAASEAGLEVASARFGRLPLPPGLVLPVLRAGLDLMLGDRLGSAAVAGVRAVRTQPPAVTVELAFAGEDRSALGQRVREVLSAQAGVAGRARVYVHLWWLKKAVEDGDLPTEGSTLPYLHFAVERAHALSQGDDAAELRAALFALTLYCGDARFHAVVGVGLTRNMQGKRNACAGTHLGGRRDLRQHFTVSAGLKAATSESAAFGIGELKELLDSNAGGSGFSFDDIAANLAGARFAALFLAAPREAWPRLLARMTTEADVMPAIAGLPAGLPEAAFRERFGDVESAEYTRLIAEIEARIAALPLHNGLALN